MKHKLRLFLLLLCCSLHASKAFAQKVGAEDSVHTISSQGNTIVQLGVGSGFTTFQQKNSHLIFQAGPALGVEFLVGRLLKNKWLIGIGGNYQQYNLNKELLEQSATELFFDYDFATYSMGSKEGKLRRSSFFVQGGYHQQNAKFLFGAFVRLGAAYSSLQLNNVLYRHRYFSNYSEYCVFKKPSNRLAFTPSAGLYAGIQLSKTSSVYIWSNYTYIIQSSKQTMHASIVTNTVENDTTIPIPVAQHAMQGGIGFLYRMQKK